MLGFTLVPAAVVVALTVVAGERTRPNPDIALRGMTTGLATLLVGAGAYLVTYLAAG